MNDYEAKKRERIERYRARAEAARREAEGRHGSARKILDYIPMGQPILVGHHSEKRHRRDLAKVDNNMRKSFEAHEKAKHYEQKADAAESNDAISSRDPDAIDKLRDKLSAMEKRQEFMKAANKIIKKNDLPGALAFGMTEAQFNRLREKDFAGRIGFPSYELTNNNANIKRVKERIAALERLAASPALEIEVEGVTVSEDTEGNTLDLSFPGIPPQEVRNYLKSNGFRWARSRGVWTRLRNNAARYHAKELVKRFYSPKPEAAPEVVEDTPPTRPGWIKARHWTGDAEYLLEFPLSELGNALGLCGWMLENSIEKTPEVVAELERLTELPNLEIPIDGDWFGTYAIRADLAAFKQ